MREYAHKKIEKKWQKVWKQTGLYKTRKLGTAFSARQGLSLPADLPVPTRQTGWQAGIKPARLNGSSRSGGDSKFYILDMFPYPSGEGLHVGHPKGYIATDVVSRMKRMQGHAVLHPMGFDAFGLPAENYAIKTKTNPETAVKKNVARYKKQLELLGFDYDWSREINTTDPNYYKWTQWIFLKMFEKGLAYQSYEPINWCPSCKTGLANEDVEDGKCERCGTAVEKKPMRQWVLKITDYAERLLADLDKLDWPQHIKEQQRNWIGRSEGAEIEFSIFNFQFSNNSKIFKKENLGEIKVFTTRPDTLFGATYLVLAPEHPLIAKIENQITNKGEMMRYIAVSKNKSEIERTAEGKEKTGVELKGIKALNPANEEEIPVWVADYVLPDYGTGAIMAVPAHDERDFEFAKKYNLPIKTVVEPLFRKEDGSDAVRKDLPLIKREAVVCVVKHWSEEKYLCLKWRKVPWSGFVTGGIDDDNPIEAGKREILEETGYADARFIKELGQVVNVQFYHVLKKENRWARFRGLYFELIDENRAVVNEAEEAVHDIHWVPRAEVEKFLSVPDMKLIWRRVFDTEKAFIAEGVLANSGQFSGMMSGEAKKKITEFVGGKIVTTYKLRDWAFSRQRYWGEPIPLIYCQKCGVVPVPEKDLPVKLPKVKYYEPTGTGESPLAGIVKWVNVKCPRCGGKACRETNTMPQWAGSSWYYLAYVTKQNSEFRIQNSARLRRWLPVDLYVGGAEHATRHLIYARFWHKFLQDIGIVSVPEPFMKLRPVGLIMGEDGRKMSKRFGNVINPDEIVARFGADSLRVYEMFMGPFDQQIAWSTDSLVGARRFLERVSRLSKRVSSLRIKDKGLTIEPLLHQTIKKVMEDIESFKFNTAVSALMILLNAFEKESSLTKGSYETFVQLLAPFAPHLSEELWEELGYRKSVHIAPWPVYDERLLDEAPVTIVVQVDGKTRGSFSAARGEPKETLKAQALGLQVVQKWLQGREIRTVIVVPDRLVNVVTEPSRGA